MAKHITEEDVSNVLKLLDGWQYELTWELLVKACEEKLGLVTTRQALSRKERIKSAFNSSKKSMKVEGKHFARPNSINIAHDRIERLARENTRLKAENEALLERFVRWQANASNRGITKEQLDRPLRKPDRGTSY